MMKTKAKPDATLLHRSIANTCMPELPKLNLILSSYYRIGKTKYMYNPTRPLQLGGGTIKKDFMPRIQDCKGLGHNAKVVMDEWQFHIA